MEEEVKKEFDFFKIITKQSNVIIFLVALAIFLLMNFVFGVKTDIQAHALLAKKMIVEGARIPGNFLYYVIIAGVSLLSENEGILILVSCFTLAFAVALKFHYTRKFIIATNTDAFSQKGKKMSSLILLAMIGAGVCVFAHNLLLIPKNMYLGNVPPNVWHNSTTIFLMPFAVLLFWKSYEMLIKAKNDYKDLIVITLLIAINLAIKPSFFLCFVAAFPLISLIKNRFNKNFWLQMIPMFVGGVLLIIQAKIIYAETTVSLYSAGSLKIAPFHIWNYFTANTIHLSLFASCLFPVLLVLAYFGQIRKSLMFQYASLIFIVSLLWYILVSETGPREFHGNFSWQAITGSYILFMASVSLFIQFSFQKDKFTRRDKILALVLSLHVISGLFYIYHILTTGSYI